jgi:hypothetical protein
MAVVACARRLRRAARRSAARALALAILTLLLGAGAVHSTVLPEPAAPAQVAQVDHHAPSISLSSEIVAAPMVDDSIVAAAPPTEPILGPLVQSPGDAARTAANTRAPPRLVSA